MRTKSWLIRLGIGIKKLAQIQIHPFELVRRSKLLCLPSWYGYQVNLVPIPSWYGYQVSVLVYRVGTDTKLTFYTGYVTETMADIDVKLIEVAIVTSDAQGNDTVGSYQAIGLSPSLGRSHPTRRKGAKNGPPHRA